MVDRLKCSLKKLKTGTLVHRRIFFMSSALVSIPTEVAVASSVSEVYEPGWDEVAHLVLVQNPMTTCDQFVRMVLGQLAEVCQTILHGPQG